MIARSPHSGHPPHRDNLACLHDYQLPEHMQLATTDLQDLIVRIGAEHVERRLKIEIEREAQLFGQGLIFFNLENWYSAPWIIRNALKLTGLYDRARRNADKSSSGETPLHSPNCLQHSTILQSFT